jgi:hypothetical protein
MLSFGRLWFVVVKIGKGGGSCDDVTLFREREREKREKREKREREKRERERWCV